MLFILSILAGCGLAILLVEKGTDWPISLWRPKIEGGLDHFHVRAREMLDCTVCTSFWATLVMDAMLFAFSGGSYFLWPVTGFAACGLVWLVYQILEAFDRLIGDGENDVEPTSTHDGKSSS